MKLSILPLLIAFVFVFCLAIVRHARSRDSITPAEARSVYALLVIFLLWTMVAIVLGVQGTHLALMPQVPLLWQAFVVIALWSTAFVVWPSFRSGLRGIATSTPGHWLVFVQALRIGALGGIVKGIQGEVTSSFVFWIGIPDFLFGLSAPLVGWMLLRQSVGRRFLILWNLFGFSLIVLPTFMPMNYWMNEPGFRFIFEFPMILAPSIVVPILISVNLLHAWGISVTAKGNNT